MSKVEVDVEKLSYGLERGIGKVDPIFKAVPEKYRLRTTVCGLASAAISDYSRREGIPSRLVISQPLLEFDRSMRHVFPLLGESNDPSPTAIDATYSQFFSYAGLHWTYEKYSGTTEFPPEKIMVFKLAQRALVAKWMAEKAAAFQKRNAYPYDPQLDRTLGRGPLATADKKAVQSAYSRIWDPDNIRAWQPSVVTRDGAKTISQSIPSGTIIFS